MASAHCRRVVCGLAWWVLHRPAFSILQNELPVNVRGLGASVYILITSIFGSLSPVLVGYLSTQVSAGLLFGLYACEVRLSLMGPSCLTDSRSFRLAVRRRAACGGCCSWW